MTFVHLPGQGSRAKAGCGRWGLFPRPGQISLFHKTNESDECFELVFLTPKSTNIVSSALTEVSMRCGAAKFHFKAGEKESHYC